MAIGTFELHTSDATGEAGDLDDRTMALLPRSLVVQLLSQSTRSACVCLCRVGHWRGSRFHRGLELESRPREVGQEQLVAIEFGFDRVEHVTRMPLIASDQTNKVAMPVKHRPNASDLSYRALPLPRAIASANKPPCTTACSILLMTLIWSATKPDETSKGSTFHKNIGSHAMHDLAI